jgi:hypothetical protein
MLKNIAKQRLEIAGRGPHIKQNGNRIPPIAAFIKIFCRFVAGYFLLR